MPEWTDLLEIEYMTQDQLKKVIQNMREQGLSEQDIQLGEDLHYKRAAFQVDKYVKMCEVREIVQQGLHSILDRFRKAEEIARKNRTEITVLDSKIKSHQQQIGHLKRIENGQTTILRMQKDQELKLVDCINTLDDMKHDNDLKRDERQRLEQDIRSQIMDLKLKSGHLQEQCTWFEKAHAKSEAHLLHFTEQTTQHFSLKFEAIEKQILSVPEVLKQQVMLVEKMKTEIHVKAADQFATVLQSLSTDQSRLSEIEIQMKEFSLIQKKLDTTYNEMLKLRKLEDGIFQSHCFIERTLPQMVHHQLCEGLNIVAGVNLQELLAFERLKTDQVYEHQKLCEGRKPNIKRFREAIEKFTESCWKHKLGSAPFTYGEQKDYWPEMHPKWANNYDKRPYRLGREEPINKKIEDHNAQRKQEMEEHVQYMFECERDYNAIQIEKQIAEASFDTRKPSRKESKARQTQHLAFQNNQQKHSVDPSQSHRSARFNPEATETYDSGNSKSNPHSPGLPLNLSLLSAQHSSKKVNEYATLGVKVSSRENVKRDASGQIIIQDQADQSQEAPSESQSQYSSQRLPYGRNQEVTIINNLKVIRKVDRCETHKIKQKLKAFLASGRTEFANQLEKWQEFFDETHDDIYELISKMEKLEGIVNQVAQTQAFAQEKSVITQEVIFEQQLQLDEQQDQLEVQQTKIDGNHGLIQDGEKMITNLSAMVQRNSKRIQQTQLQLQDNDVTGEESQEEEGDSQGDEESSEFEEESDLTSQRSGKIDDEHVESSKERLKTDSNVSSEKRLATDNQNSTPLPQVKSMKDSSTKGSVKKKGILKSNTTKVKKKATVRMQDEIDSKTEYNEANNVQNKKEQSSKKAPIQTPETQQEKVVKKNISYAYDQEPLLGYSQSGSSYTQQLARTGTISKRNRQKKVVKVEEPPEQTQNATESVNNATQQQPKQTSDHKKSTFTQNKRMAKSMLIKPATTQKGRALMSIAESTAEMDGDLSSIMIDEASVVDNKQVRLNEQSTFKSSAKSSAQSSVMTSIIERQATRQKQQSQNGSILSQTEQSSSDDTKVQSAIGQASNGPRPSRMQRISKLQMLNQAMPSDSPIKTSIMGKAKKQKEDESDESDDEEQKTKKTTSAKESKKQSVIKVQNLKSSQMKKQTRSMKVDIRSSSSSSSSESVDTSLNNADLKEKEPEDDKSAGIGFKFARAFQRETMSRAQLTNYVQDKFDQIQKDASTFQSKFTAQYDELLKLHDQSQKSNLAYQTGMVFKMEKFTTNITKEVLDKGLQMQELLLSRIDSNEAHVNDFEIRLTNIEKENLRIRQHIDQEFKDFTASRKRWKSDFQIAADKSKANLAQVQAMILGCETQNEVNTAAIKMIIDAQMIEQLMSRQEVEDKKQLLVLATKKDREMMCTDHGIHAKQIFGPKVDYESLKHDRNKSQPSPSRTINGLDSTTNNAAVGGAMDAVKDFEDNATKITPPVLSVDRACLNCANNKPQTLNAIKVACLCHTQSPIPYQGRDYHVSQMLDVKAEIVAKCQRMVRENLFQSKESAGIDIRAEDNEKGFIITPLVDVTPIKVEADLASYMKQREKKQTDPNSPSFALEKQSLADSSVHVGRKEALGSKYPSGSSPKNNGRQTQQDMLREDSIVLGLIEDKTDRDEVNYNQSQPTIDDQMVLNKSQNKVSHIDDLYSSRQKLESQSISVAQKRQRGHQSQLSQYQDPKSGIQSKKNFAQYRFSSMSKIQTSCRNKDDPMRRSMFDHPNQQQTLDQGQNGALPDVLPQRGNYPRKSGNLDFEHMFDSSQNASTKMSHVRQSSQNTGYTTQQNFMPKSTRYTANRINHSVIEDNYRATDGFTKNLQIKNLAQKKLIEINTNQFGSRPQTQQQELFHGGKRGNNSFQQTTLRK